MHMNTYAGTAEPRKGRHDIRFVDCDGKEHGFSLHCTSAGLSLRRPASRQLQNPIISRTVGGGIQIGYGQSTLRVLLQGCKDNSSTQRDCHLGVLYEVCPRRCRNAAQLRGSTSTVASARLGWCLALISRHMPAASIKLSFDQRWSTSRERMGRWQEEVRDCVGARRHARFPSGPHSSLALALEPWH
jgi:hypothetical protein